jgi:hypothetical protein
VEPAFFGIAAADINLRLVDVPAYPKHEKRREDADPEQDLPGERLGHEGVDAGVQQRARGPADTPAGLHQPDRAAAILVAHCLADQHRTGRPLAAKAKAVQRTQHEKLLEILREAAKEGEHRVPQDRDLQHPHAAIAIAQRAGKPAAERRDQQRHRADKASLALADRPQCDQRRHYKAVDLDIERIERPAAKTGEHRAALLGVQVPVPTQHAFPPDRPPRLLALAGSEADNPTRCHGAELRSGHATGNGP